MKKLPFILFFLVLHGCKKSDNTKVDQNSSQSTKVVTVTSKTGRIWMDRNLGATQVATSSTDAASYGDLYQWGRTADGHQLRNSGTTNILSNTDQPGNTSFILSPAPPYNWRSIQNDNLWQGVNGINNPCPSGFRIPTYEEWIEESSSWVSRDAAGAFNSPLKLTIGGQRRNDTGEIRLSQGGNYWTSTTNSQLQTTSILTFGLTGYSSGTRYRSDGNSCRCIKN